MSVPTSFLLVPIRTEDVRDRFLSTAAGATVGGAVSNPCPCYDCATGQRRQTMIVCVTCGNKRCPHGTNHAERCTGSNKPGQAGSRYA